MNHPPPVINPYLLKINDEHTTNIENFSEHEKVGSTYSCEILIDRSEIFHTSLTFAAVIGKKPPSHLDRYMS